MAGCHVHVFDFSCLLIQVQRDRGEQNENPNSRTDTNSHFVVLPLCRQRVCHDPVPLHAEAGDEEHGTVHVPIEEAHQDFAQGLPVDPVVSVYVVGDFQRHPHNKEQVSQGEVGHVDGGRVLLLGPEEEHPYGHPIRSKPHHEHEGVDDWEEHSGETAFQSL